MALISSSPALRKRTDDMFQRLILALFCLAAFTPTSFGQMRGGMVPPPHFTSGFAGGSFGGRFGRSGYGYGFAYYGTPFLYADYPVTSLAYPAPAPQVIVIQPASGGDTTTEKRIDPLLIELQGNQYVRFEGGRAQTAATNPSGTILSASVPSTIPNQSKSGEPPPAVLVYRDGHREQVSNYAIVSGVMYAQGNYWQDGYWTKNIQLAALDIPATIKANQASGVKFILPSSPNEVVTRP